MFKIFVHTSKLLVPVVALSLSNVGEKNIK